MARGDRAPPRIVATETLYRGWGRYLRVTIETGGERVPREVEDHGEAAALLAYDPRRLTALLVRQLRAPMLLVGEPGETLEVAAGCLDGDEAPEACIRREALEELGLTVGALEPVVAMQTMPGVSTERIHLFLGSYRPEDRTGAGGGLAEEHEEIKVVEMALADLADLADRGELRDGKTFALLQVLRLRRPELFAGPPGGASV